MLYEYSASSKRKIIKSNYITGENESFKLSVTMSSNFQRTFAHLVAAIDVLNNPPPLQHAPGLPPQLPPPLHPAPASPPAASTPPVPASPTMPVLHAAPPPTSSTDGSIRGKPKLVREGHSYSYHKQRTSGYILWRCDVNNKAAREKGISCNATALTTGDLPTSTLEWSRPHSHAPGAISVRESMKTNAVISTRMPHKIVADGLLDTSRDVQYNLPPKKSLKRMIQKTRKKQAVIANPQLALACDRSLISLYIPVDLLQSWKNFDSGSGMDRIFMLSSGRNGQCPSPSNIV